MEQVFEVGQVLEWNASGKTRILSRIDETGLWYGCGPDCNGEVALGSERILHGFMRLVAPTPKPGMQWQSGDKVVDIRQIGDHLCATPQYSWHESCYGTVVEIARWLLDNGYKPVVEANEKKPSANVFRHGTRIQSDCYTGTLRQVGDWWHVAWDTPHGEDFGIPHDSAYVMRQIERGHWRTADNSYKPVEYWSQERLGGSGETIAQAAARNAIVQHETPHNREFDLQNATVLDARSNLGHIWRDGTMWTITWSDKAGECWHATHSAEAIRDLIARGIWTRIEVPAKEEPKPADGWIMIYPSDKPLTINLPSCTDGAHPTPDGVAKALAWHREGCMRRAGLDPYPNITAARPFFDLIAAVYTTPTREQSRQYVDMAVAAIKGEPFWRAIQAVLVGASDRSALPPLVVAELIDACRMWESRRSEIAPGRRTLNEGQFETLWKAVGTAHPIWVTSNGAVYERARSAC